MLSRILLIAVLGLSVGACVPYSDGGSYYSSEVYTSPAPYYSDGGAYYSSGGYYSAPRRYYAPPARYYQPTPRYYYQPRVYQPAPRYYQAPRGDYRRIKIRAGMAATGVAGTMTTAAAGVATIMAGEAIMMVAAITMAGVVGGNQF